MSSPILFVSPLLAMPQQHGGCVYPDAVLTALHASGVAIDYAWLAWPLRSPRIVMRDPLQSSYVNKGYVPGTVRLGGWRFRTLREWFSSGLVSSRGDSEVEPLPSREDQHFFRTLIERLRPRSVLIDCTPTLTVLDGLSEVERARFKVGVLTHNLIHRRTQLYRDRGLPLDFRPMTMAEETALLRRADVIVAIQEREAQEFEAMVHDRTVVVVPLPVKPKPQPVEAIVGKRCLFVGGYSGHNLDGLQWFLEKVWPLVMAAVPETELDVAGTVGEALHSDVARVHVLGKVEHLASVYSKATVCVVPLRFGTGLKIKLVEAMSFGRAVVTTAAGAEGFPELEAGEIAMVAADAESMAAAIVHLLNEPVVREAQVHRQNVWLSRRFKMENSIRPLLEAEFTKSVANVGSRLHGNFRHR